MVDENTLEESRLKVTSGFSIPTVPNQEQSSYTIQFLRYGPDKVLKVKVTTARSKVKSGTHDIAYLQSPTKNKVHTPYSFGDMAEARF